MIEIDGDTHSTEQARIYDDMRTALLNLYGLRVVRFTNDDIYERFDQVCCEIE